MQLLSLRSVKWADPSIGNCGGLRSRKVCSALLPERRGELRVTEEDRQRKGLPGGGGHMLIGKDEWNVEGRGWAGVVMGAP